MSEQFKTHKLSRVVYLVLSGERNKVLCKKTNILTLIKTNKETNGKDETT